jgi:hypothetical protein
MDDNGISEHFRESRLDGLSLQHFGNGVFGINEDFLMDSELGEGFCAASRIMKSR